MTKSRKSLYRLYYDPVFPFLTAKFQHSEGNSRIDREVRDLVKSIDKTGMRNPLFVTMYDDFCVIHPGKCRAKALKLLGFDTAPALIYVPSGVNRKPSGQRDELTPDSAAALFSGDIVCEWDARWFAVKRTIRA